MMTLLNFLPRWLIREVFGLIALVLCIVMFIAISIDAHTHPENTISGMVSIVTCLLFILFGFISFMAACEDLGYTSIRRRQNMERRRKIRAEWQRRASLHRKEMEGEADLREVYLMRRKEDDPK